MGSKKDYTVYLKDYMKKVVKYLEDNGKADQVDSFKTNISKVMKELLGKSKDPDAMIMVIDYREHKGEERPILIAFKHGLEEEKVQFWALHMFSNLYVMPRINLL